MYASRCAPAVATTNDPEKRETACAIARAFAAQFDAMTDGTVPRCVPGGGGTGALARLDVWLPDARTYELVHTTNLLAGLAAWTNRTQGLPAGRGFQALALTNEAERRFFRVRSAP